MIIFYNILQFFSFSQNIVHNIPANKQYCTFGVSLTYKSRALSHDAMLRWSNKYLNHTILGGETLPIILTMCNVSRLPNHLTLDNIHGFFFLFYSPFSLSKKIFRGNSTLIHKSLNNASMSCKTSLTELVFDEWKWERRERKRFHSFIAQKTRSLSKRLRPIVLWNATRSIFVSLFKILSKNVQYLINHIFPFCLIMFEIYVSIFLFLIYRFEFSP